MANIRVDVNFTIKDGCDVVFKAPCSASEVTGLVVYYPNSNGVKVSQLFTFKDAHGNNLNNIDNLFASGALVKVILDTVNSNVYILNADTNAYIEGNFSKKSVKVNTTLSAASWSGAQYTLSNSNITATNVIEILPQENNGVTSDQFDALASAKIIGGTQAVGSIVLVALGDVPTIDIPVTIIFRSDL